MATPYIWHVHSEVEMTTLLKRNPVVVIAFHAGWSAPCRDTAPLYSHLAAKHRTLTFVKVEINTENIQTVGQKCRLTELPTFIMIKNEEEIDRIRGVDQKGLEDMIVKHAPKAVPIASGSGYANAGDANDSSLLEYLDMSQVNCLNEAQDHTLRSIVERKRRNTTEAYLESDADEQLLITLRFNRVVKIRSIVLHSEEPKFGPKDIKIDINRPALDFGDVENATEPEVIQVLELSEELVKEGSPIPLRFVRLQRVTSLHIFVESNHGGEDITRIDAIDLYGPDVGEPATTTQMNGLRDFWGIYQQGMNLLSLFQREGGIRNLSSSVLLFREALLICPIRIQQHATISANLARALLQQYNQRGDSSDLLEAITIHYELVELRPRHPDHATILSNLSSALLTRYERGGSLTDLSDAIERNREALELRPHGHPARYTNFVNLSNVLLARYRREGSPADLSDATEHYREALEVCPDGHPDRAPVLSNLSNALVIRYLGGGSLKDLVDATEHYSEALDLSPPGHPDRGSSLASLSTALLIRYQREGNLTDLSVATGHYREALELCPRGHPDRTQTLNSLSSALLLRYKREGNLTDLSDATEYYQEALELRPPGHPDRSTTLINISTALMARYDHEGNLADLTDAVEYYEETLDLCPYGHPLRALTLNNFSHALVARYEREGNFTDLSDAAKNHREALDLRPRGNPDRAQSLSSMSRVLLLTITTTTDNPDIHGQQTLVNEVFEMLREAASLFNCPPRDRLWAALQWIEASRRLTPDSMLDAYNAALDQLDISLATSNTIENKHKQLASDNELAGCKQLGVEAASYAVRQGQMALAVELLERGRNLLFAQIGRYRVDLEDLRRVDVDLADRFSGLSSLLDASVVSNQPNLEGRTAFEDPTERYRRVSSEWKQAIDDIRAVEEFEHFLKSPDYTELRSAAAEGPIIVVIPGHSQSDALIISRERDTPHHVTLPEASTEKLRELCNTLILAVHSDNEFATEQSVKKILRSLWRLVVGPIADALENELHIPLHSRIWWCPTYLLSFLPLHAAGRYGPGDTNQNLPDRYVSSYTPTLHALGRARRDRGVSKGEKMLIVAQPDTPDQSQLPNAQVEAELVKKLVEPKMESTFYSGKEGTRGAVLDAMVNHSWLHLACHGSQDFVNPFQSCFCLYGGKLTLHDIMQRGLPDAKFAFLAACHTATGDNRLLDEGLHLAAGLQFVGFKSVVGTIWEVADDDGPVIAEAFYKALQEEQLEGDGMDCSGAAQALSKAVKRLRDNGVPVNRWMRFIHTGI